jgi:uncharacterized FlaG/YvyC family protein
MKFTPGPIEISAYIPNGYVLYDQNKKELAHVFSRADAELYAAAPEMWEGIIKFLKIADEYADEVLSEHINNGLVKIIEKATGQKIEEVLK